MKKLLLNKIALSINKIVKYPNEKSLNYNSLASITSSNREQVRGMEYHPKGLLVYIPVLGLKSIMQLPLVHRAVCKKCRNASFGEAPANKISTQQRHRANSGAVKGHFWSHYFQRQRF